MDLTRHSTMFDNEKLKTTRIQVIGAGGIGSFAVNTLAKMGFENIQVWDKDVVEEHNIPNQNYQLSQTDVVKVEALQFNVMRYTGTDLDVRNDFWDGKDVSYHPNIIITTVDSMDIRMGLWEGFKTVLSPDKNLWF